MKSCAENLLPLCWTRRWTPRHRLPDILAHVMVTSKPRRMPVVGAISLLRRSSTQKLKVSYGVYDTLVYRIPLTLLPGTWYFFSHLFVRSYIPCTSFYYTKTVTLLILPLSVLVFYRQYTYIRNDSCSSVTAVWRIAYQVFCMYMFELPGTRLLFVFSIEHSTLDFS